MLAAPDIDFNVFAQQLARVGPDHVTVFVSGTDRALALSSRIAGDRPRLGGLDPNNQQSREALEALGVSLRKAPDAPTVAPINGDVAPDSLGAYLTLAPRIGLTDESQKVLQIDWRAPAAAPFYQATAASPSGVLRRRHITTEERRVIGLSDEVLDPDKVDPNAVEAFVRAAEPFGFSAGSVFCR